MRQADEFDDRKEYCSNRLKIMRSELVSISPVAGGWVFTPQPWVYAGHFNSDPKEPFARRVIMAAWEKGRPLRAKVFMARGAFNRNVLRIATSDLDDTLKET